MGSGLVISPIGSQSSLPELSFSTTGEEARLAWSWSCPSKAPFYRKQNSKAQVMWPQDFFPALPSLLFLVKLWLGTPPFPGGLLQSSASVLPLLVLLLLSSVRRVPALEKLTVGKEATMLRANCLTRQSREVVLQMDRRLRAHRGGWASRECFTEEVAQG